MDMVGAKRRDAPLPPNRPTDVCWRWGCWGLHFEKTRGGSPLRHRYSTIRSTHLEIVGSDENASQTPSIFASKGSQRGRPCIKRSISGLCQRLCQTVPAKRPRRFKCLRDSRFAPPVGGLPCELEAIWGYTRCIQASSLPRAPISSNRKGQRRRHETMPDVARLCGAILVYRIDHWVP